MHSATNSFGTYPYGTEVCDLVHIGNAFSTESTEPDSESDSNTAFLDRVTALVTDAEIAGSKHNRQLSEEELSTIAFFRWITGHQATCMVFQALVGLLSQEKPSKDLSKLCDFYAFLTLYTGSCTKETYGRVIRPFMMHAHACFSGTWAGDFHPLKKLKKRFEGQPEYDEFRTSFKQAWQVHSEVGKWLIGTDPSLLRENKQAVDEKPEDKAFRFDSFFLIRRCAFQPSLYEEQLLRRVDAIWQDLVINGLLFDDRTECIDTRMQNLRQIIYSGTIASLLAPRLR